MAHQKPIPAESQVLGLLDLVPQIRAWAPIEEIESIDITLSERALRHVADPPKYDPQTRETADHSLPYMLTVALVDGRLTPASFEPERYLDKTLRPLMNRIRVAENAEFTRRFPQELVSEITVTTRSGQRLVSLTFIESQIPDEQERAMLFELGEVSALEGNNRNWVNRMRLEIVRQNLTRKWSR